MEDMEEVGEEHEFAEAENSEAFMNDLSSVDSAQLLPLQQLTDFGDGFLIAEKHSHSPHGHHSAWEQTHGG